MYVRISFMSELYEFDTLLYSTLNLIKLLFLTKTNNVIQSYQVITHY